MEYLETRPTEGQKQKRPDTGNSVSSVDFTSTFIKVNCFVHIQLFVNIPGKLLPVITDLYDAD